VLVFSLHMLVVSFRGGPVTAPRTTLAD
jgi:hypothetical protein